MEGESLRSSFTVDNIQDGVEEIEIFKVMFYVPFWSK